MTCFWPAEPEPEPDYNILATKVIEILRRTGALDKPYPPLLADWERSCERCFALERQLSAAYCERSLVLRQLNIAPHLAEAHREYDRIHRELSDAHHELDDAYRERSRILHELAESLPELAGHDENRKVQS